MSPLIAWGLVAWVGIGLGVAVLISLGIRLADRRDVESLAHLEDAVPLLHP